MELKCHMGSTEVNLRKHKHAIQEEKFGCTGCHIYNSMCIDILHLVQEPYCVWCA